jgi:chromosome segregation ATPase
MGSESFKEVKMSEYKGAERRAAPEVLEFKINLMHQDVSEIKTALKELTSAITRLALVEERLASTAAAQERAFSAISSLEKRLVEIEKRLPEYSRVSVWVDRGVWAAAAAAIVFAAKKAGLL